MTIEAEGGCSLFGWSVWLVGCIIGNSTYIYRILERVLKEGYDTARFS